MRCNGFVTRVLVSNALRLLVGPIVNFVFKKEKKIQFSSRTITRLAGDCIFIVAN